MSTAVRFATDPRRRGMVAKIKIAQKELGLDDDTYRAMLQWVTGRSSAADCNDAQLGAMLDELKAKGWTPRVVAGSKTGGAQARPARADHPMAGKARALWISLHHLGVVRQPSEQALEAFAKRQLHVERLQWADESMGYLLIEALKAMAERAGWSQDVSEDAILRTFRGQRRSGAVVTLKVRLVAAQWARLSELGAIRGGQPPVCSGLSDWAQGKKITPGLRSHTAWTEAELDAAIPKLGYWLRTTLANTGAPAD